MRKLIFLLFFFIGFTFLFSSNKNSAYAITCAQAGGSCTPSKVCDAEGVNRINATGCTSTTAPVCCNFDSVCKKTQDVCTSLGFNCGTVVNNCNQQGTCGTCSTGTCSNNKCDSAGTTCQTCASLNYQCGTFVNNCGKTITCGNSGKCSDTSKTCDSNFCVNPQNCSDIGGTCMAVCSSPLSGTTGCTAPSVCCGTGNTSICPKCTSPYYYDPYTKKCAFYSDSQGKTLYSEPVTETCTAEQICVKGCGCNCELPNGFTSGSLPCGVDGKNCYTAFGKISLSPTSLVKDIFGIVLSIGGGIAVILIIISGYKIISSQGNPDRIKDAQEQLTAAIIGLLFVIFAFSILKFINIDVLNIFSQ